MVDSVNRPNQPVQPSQVGGDVNVQGGPQQVQTSQGVGGGENLTVSSSGGAQNVDVSGLTHDDIQTPSSNANPNMPTAMDNMDAPEWDETVNITDMLNRALAEAGDDQNELQKQANEMSVDEQKEWYKSMLEKGDDMIDKAGNKALYEGFKMGVQIGTGFGQMGTSGNQGISAGVGQVGGAAGGGIGIGEDLDQAAYDKELNADDMDIGLAQQQQQKSEGLRDKFGSGFSKTMSAQDEVTRQGAEMYNSGSKGL